MRNTSVNSYQLGYSNSNEFGVEFELVCPRFFRKWQLHVMEYVFVINQHLISISLKTGNPFSVKIWKTFYLLRNYVSSVKNISFQTQSNLHVGQMIFDYLICVVFFKNQAIKTWTFSVPFCRMVLDWLIKYDLSIQVCFSNKITKHVFAFKPNNVRWIVLT